MSEVETFLTKCMNHLEKEFREKGWILADMDESQLKKFMDETGFEYDKEEELPPIESYIHIGKHGGLKYFSDGREIVLAFNDEPYSDLDKKYDKEIREIVLKWLIENDIDWRFE